MVLPIASASIVRAIALPAIDISLITVRPCQQQSWVQVVSTARHYRVILITAASVARMPLVDGTPATISYRVSKMDKASQKLKMAPPPVGSRGESMLSVLSLSRFLLILE
jgi:hypothetical protein